DGQRARGPLNTVPPLLAVNRQLSTVNPLIMPPHLVRRFIKPLLFLLCLVPFLSVVWRALELGGTDLGANPVEAVQDTFGQWGLRFLVITLAITPLRDWFNAPWLVMLRPMLGLFAFAYVLLH